MTTANDDRPTRAAVVQMVSGVEVAANLSEARALIRAAVDQGAECVVLPENFAFLGRHPRDVLDVAEADGDGPIQTALAAAARDHGITVVGGSVPLRADEADRVRAACLVYGPGGERLARYDKRHLFDVSLPGGESYRESDTFAPGEAIVVADTPAGPLGLSICYDLRFPEHYRALVDAGATLLLAPSAFTATTGAAHWSVLVRARAIENACPVLAPNQGGRHANGRATHGESLIVDPWGTCLAAAGVGSGPEVVVADLDPAYRREVRERLPALEHRRG
jgi:nitrilase